MGLLYYIYSIYKMIEQKKITIRRNTNRDFLPWNQYKFRKELIDTKIR